MGRKSGEKIGSSYCHGLGGNQVFAYTKRSQIMSDDNCLDSSSANGPVNLVRCHGMQGNQEWIFDDDVSILIIFRTIYEKPKKCCISVIYSLMSRDMYGH